MAVSDHYLAFVVFSAFTVFLRLPHLTSGLHSPLNVKAEAANGTDFLIISWDFQAEANYSMIHVRSYFNLPGMKGSDTSTVHPTQPFCDGAKCSFCVSDVNNLKLCCHTFNPGYLFSIKLSLGFEMLVSYKVGACSTNKMSSCLDSMWQNYIIPPGAPSAVRNVQARPLSSKSVEVSWTAPNQTRGTIQVYTVYYKASDGKERYIIFSPEFYNNSKGKITGLQPKTTYTIWMVASTWKKNGERSNVTSVTTYGNECASSPCYRNSQCKLAGDSYECACPENLGGKNCNEPKGYTVNTNKCLDYDLYISFEANVTLTTCFKKCKDDSSCKSFGYGRGYDRGGSFKSDLYMKDVGQCKRWNADQTSYKLKWCWYDYYEKERPKGSTAAVVPLISLLGLSVVISVLK